VLDLAGNAAEWVADFLDDTDNDQGYGYRATPQTNPRGPATGVYHVVRGGSYRSGAAWVRGAARGHVTLGRADNVGFRCAADAR
jgi:formylglycine-generating enzyme required for sulfatase activity